ncbi:hypothetical protein D3C75_1129230 [compost metagenome]
MLIQISEALALSVFQYLHGDQDELLIQIGIVVLLKGTLGLYSDGAQHLFVVSKHHGTECCAQDDDIFGRLPEHRQLAPRKHVSTDNGCQYHDNSHNF